MNITDRVVSKQRFFAHLRALAASKKSGTLIVTEPGVERRLYFEEGAIVAAKSTLREESMGYLLAERDIIKANKVKQAEDLLSDRAALLGRKLLELGVMSEDEIGNAVRLTVREAISNILASPEAEITLNDERFPDVDRVPVFVDVNRLMSAGIEAAEKKILTPDREESPATSTAEETVVLEPEPEETLASRAEHSHDPDGQLMEALEGFSEKYSREGATGSRTTGPITKPYAVVPEVDASRPSKSPGASGLPVGIIAAGVAGVVLLGGGGYWFLNRSPESGANRVADRVDIPATPIVAGAPSETSAAPQPMEAEQLAESSAQPAAAELGASSNAAPRAPERTAPSPPSPSPSAARQPVERPAAAPPPPARPAPRQPAPTPTPPLPQANPEPVNAQPETAPVASQPAESEPSSPPSGNVGPGPSAPDPQPIPSEPTQQGAPGDWGSAIFAPKQATVSSAPSNPGVQTGDLVEPGFDVIDPVLIEHPKLRYPDEAKRQKITEAVVRVRVLVDHTGAVQDAKLEKGAGHGFDEVALATALQARFIPATKDQVQVKIWTVLPLVFRLDD